MTDYECPECDGGFPASDAVDKECPWCGQAMDGEKRTTLGRRMLTDLTEIAVRQEIESADERWELPELNRDEHDLRGPRVGDSDQLRELSETPRTELYERGKTIKLDLGDRL